MTINFKGEMMKKAVITILGIQGGYVQNNEVKFSNFDHRAKYYFEFEGQANENAEEFFNTLPLLIQKYQDTHTIIPVFTEDARIFNKKVLEDAYSTLALNFDEKYLIKDDKNFNEIFSLIDKTISDFDEVIVDVSHGFRHLPILMIVDLIIQNFQNTQKIQKIFFAKEIIKHEPKQKGLYEMIDLKDYLDLANISFILTTFKKNYTVANHIKSIKYPDLMNALKDFSNDIMALSLNNLFKSSAQTLIGELKKIDNVSVQRQTKELLEHIQELTAYEGKKRYQTYFDLSKELFEKNYMLLSLALLFESIRMYIKTTIKKGHPELIGRVETFFEDDLYKIGSFCKNLKDKDFRSLTKELKKQIKEEEYEILQTNFKNLNIKDLYERIDKKRNNLAHANSDTNAFQTIKDDIQKLLKEYEDNFINPK
jgi:CRISPR-associated DxTHG motif protein